MPDGLDPADVTDAYDMLAAQELARKRNRMLRDQQTLNVLGEDIQDPIYHPRDDRPQQAPQPSRRGPRLPLSRGNQDRTDAPPTSPPLDPVGLAARLMGPRIPDSAPSDEMQLQKRGAPTPAFADTSVSPKMARNIAAEPSSVAPQDPSLTRKLVSIQDQFESNKDFTANPMTDEEKKFVQPTLQQRLMRKAATPTGSRFSSEDQAFLGMPQKPVDATLQTPDARGAAGRGNLWAALAGSPVGRQMAKGQASSNSDGEDFSSDATARRAHLQGQGAGSAFPAVAPDMRGDTFGKYAPGSRVGQSSVSRGANGEVALTGPTPTPESLAAILANTKRRRENMANESLLAKMGINDARLGLDRPDNATLGYNKAFEIGRQQRIQQPAAAQYDVMMKQADNAQGNPRGNQNGNADATQFDDRAKQFQGLLQSSAQLHQAADAKLKAGDKVGEQRFRGMAAQAENAAAILGNQLQPAAAPGPKKRSLPASLMGQNPVVNQSPRQENRSGARNNQMAKLVAERNTLRASQQSRGAYSYAQAQQNAARLNQIESEMAALTTSVPATKPEF